MKNRKNDTDTFRKANDEKMLKDVIERVNLKYKKERIECFRALDWVGARINSGSHFKYIIRRNDGLYFVFDENSYKMGRNRFDITKLLKEYDGPKRFKLSTTAEYDEYYKTVYAKASKIGHFEAIYMSYSNDKTKTVLNFLEAKNTKNTNNEEDLDTQRLRGWRRYDIKTFEKIQIKGAEWHTRSKFVVYKLKTSTRTIYCIHTNNNIKQYYKALSVLNIKAPSEHIKALEWHYKWLNISTLIEQLDPTRAPKNNFDELFEL